MSIDSFLINRVDLYEMVPSADASGGDDPTPTLRKSNIRCSVQAASNATYFKWMAQNKQVGLKNIYFKGNLSWTETVDGVEVTRTITVQDGTPMKDYRFYQTDKSGTSVYLRMLGFGEATLGKSQVWKAEVEQVA